MRKWLLAALLLSGSASAQNVETVPPLCTVAQLAAGTCAPAFIGTRVRISNGNVATGDTDCAVGTGAFTVLCEYNAGAWVSIDTLYTLGPVASGAPDNLDYLVGTITGGLSNEIVVGTAPGGELGNSWASPSIDDGVSVTSWNLTTPIFTGKIDGAGATNDDDCTGEQSAMWWDATDLQWEVCNLNTGVPIPLTGGGVGTGDIESVGDCPGPGACFGGASGTTLTSTTNETLIIGQLNRLVFGRDDAGSVTFMGADDASPATTIFDTTGAGKVQLGSADVMGIDQSMEGYKEITATADRAGVLTTLEGADIDNALSACSTDKCTIRLVEGTYTDVCVQILSLDQGIRILGKGAGTILKPYADQDDCIATNQGQMIEVNGSDNVELGDFVIDGDKQNVSFTNTTCADNTLTCGRGIWVNSPSNNISKNLYIHDLEIKNTMKAGITLQHVNGAVVERTSVHDIGCHQTAGVGDNTCGCALGAGCGGWDAAPEIGIVGLGLRAKGPCIIASNMAKDVVIRNNVVDDCMYSGIEVFDTYASDGHNYEIHSNEVSGAPSGIVVGAGRQVHIHDNYVHDNALTGGTGDNGVGILLSSSTTTEVVIERNWVVDNASAGMNLKPTTGRGLTVRNNRIEDNCVTHDTGGGNLSIHTSGTLFQDLLVESNTISGSSGCTGGSMTSGTTGSSMGGDVQFLGGTNDDDVSLNNTNLFVSGLDVTGTLLFGAASAGIALDNDTGATTYMAGSLMSRLDSGVLTLSAGTASGQFQLMEPSASGSNKATIVTQAMAADTAYTLPADDGDAGEQLQTNGSGSLTWEAAGGGGYTFSADGDNSVPQTLSSGDTLLLLGGTNGIDTVASATDTITFNLDLSESSAGGELGGLLSAPTIDDNLAVSSWQLTTPTMITSTDFGVAGVRVTDDGDGAITLTGLGNGSDEDITLNLDDSANTLTLSSSTSLSNINFGTIIAHTTNSDWDLRMDFDNNGSNAFNVRDGLNAVVMSVDESGNLQIDGDLTVDGNDINLGATGVRITDDTDGAITFLGRSTGSDEDFTLNLDDTANTVAVSSSTGVTSFNFGTIPVVSPAPIASSTGGTLALNTITLATAAADYDIPDNCDTATGAFVVVQVRDSSEVVSITTLDTSDTIVYKGEAGLIANDELDSPGAAGDSVGLICLEADKWYMTSTSGAWVDGGPAD